MRVALSVNRGKTKPGPGHVLHIAHVADQHLRRGIIRQWQPPHAKVLDLLENGSIVYQGFRLVAIQVSIGEVGDKRCAVRRMAPHCWHGNDVVAADDEQVSHDFALLHIRKITIHEQALVGLPPI